MDEPRGHISRHVVFKARAVIENMSGETGPMVSFDRNHIEWTSDPNTSHARGLMKRGQVLERALMEANRIFGNPETIEAFGDEGEDENPVRLLVQEMSKEDGFDGLHWLYMDGSVRVSGETRGSGGYLYIVASYL